MSRRWALIVLTVLMPAALLTFLVGADWGPALFAALASVMPIALMVVGAERRGRLGSQALPIGLLMVILPAAMAGLIFCRGLGLGGPWWGGLPAAAAIQLYGLFVLPLLISTLGYALTFDRSGLSQWDLDELRARFPDRIEADQDRGEMRGRPERSP